MTDPSLRVACFKVENDSSRPNMKREIYLTDENSCFASKMFEHLRMTELKFFIFPTYTDRKNVKQIRPIAIDWLIGIHQKFRMMPETLFLAVNFIDRLLEKRQIKNEMILVMVVSALSLAAKSEVKNPPTMKKLRKVIPSGYCKSKEEILIMQSDIATAFDYQLTVPTVQSFMFLFLKAAGADKEMNQLSCYLAECALHVIDLVKFLPSQIAATVIYIAQKSLGRDPWSPTLLNCTHYDDELDQVKCCRYLEIFMSEAKYIKQLSVFRKYADSQFGCVSTTKLCFNDTEYVKSHDLNDVSTVTSLSKISPKVRKMNHTSIVALDAENRNRALIQQRLKPQLLISPILLGDKEHQSISTISLSKSKTYNDSPKV